MWGNGCALDVALAQRVGIGVQLHVGFSDKARDARGSDTAPRGALAGPSYALDEPRGHRLRPEAAGAPRTPARRARAPGAAGREELPGGGGEALGVAGLHQRHRAVRRCTTVDGMREATAGTLEAIASSSGSPNPSSGREGKRRRSQAPQRPRDLRRRHAAEIAVRRQQGPLRLAQRQGGEAQHPAGDPRLAQPADGRQRGRHPLDLGLEDPRDGDPRPPPGRQPPGGAEQGIERRRRRPGSPARSARAGARARCGATVSVGSCQE